MAGWADGACQPCRQGQEGRSSLGNLEGGLGKTGKGSKGRKEGACLEWGAEVGAPVPCQVWSVGVPWVPASLACGLGGLACCSAPLPSPSKQKDVRSLAWAAGQQQLPLRHPSQSEGPSQSVAGTSLEKRGSKQLFQQ